VAFVRTDVLEERIASIIRVTRIGQLGTTLSVTSNRASVLTRIKRRNIPEGAIHLRGYEVACILLETHFVMPWTVSLQPYAAFCAFLLLFFAEMLYVKHITVDELENNVKAVMFIAAL
jgi:hypothetical protein